MESTATTSTWEAELAGFLEELSATQAEMLGLLGEKQKLLVTYDGPGLAALAEREHLLMARLQACTDRRVELLSRAETEGRPHGSIRELAHSLSHSHANPLTKQVQQASSRARILQHHSITNWIVVQRTLIHLSQMLEIIATGGRTQPTYGRGETAQSSGALVDQAA